MYLRTPQYPHLFFPSNPQIPIRTQNASLLKVHSKLNNNVMENITTSEPKSFYELLGIQESDSLFEIKAAYKQLARKYHPDVSPPGRVEEYTQRFIKVQEAYETLSDPMSRHLYDLDMSKGLHFAFSARRSSHNYEMASSLKNNLLQKCKSMEEKGEWKNIWQSQLSELNRRSRHKDSAYNNMSWGARMRRQKN